MHSHNCTCKHVYTGSIFAGSSNNYVHVYVYLRTCNCTLNCNTPYHTPSSANSGDTSKNAVLQYISRMSDDTMHTSQDPDLSPRDRDMAIDDTLLWRFLFLLCQQNGVLVPSDISELLTKGLDTPISPPRGVGVGGVKETERDEDALQEFRLYLLSGRKKVGWVGNGGYCIQCTLYTLPICTLYMYYNFVFMHI